MTTAATIPLSNFLTVNPPDHHNRIAAVRPGPFPSGGCGFKFFDVNPGPNVKSARKFAPDAHLGRSPGKRSD